MREENVRLGTSEAKISGVDNRRKSNLLAEHCVVRYVTGRVGLGDAG